MNRIGWQIAFSTSILLLLAGCTTTSTTEQKTPDMATKVDATQRAQIHTERAGEYFRLGSMQIALEAAQQAISAQPNYAPAHNMLGLIHMELRQDAKAQAAFEQAIKLAPADSGALNNFGWFLCQRIDASQSLPVFERALRDPLYTTPHRALYNAGVCARKAGDLVAAERSLRASLQRAPEFSGALFELADLLFVQGRSKDAELVFARYSRSVRELDANGLLLGVRLSRASGDRNAEAGYVAQLRRRFPDAPQTRDATPR